MATPQNSAELKLRCGTCGHTVPNTASSYWQCEECGRKEPCCPTCAQESWDCASCDPELCAYGDCERVADFRCGYCSRDMCREHCRGSACSCGEGRHKEHERKKNYSPAQQVLCDACAAQECTHCHKRNCCSSCSRNCNVCGVRDLCERCWQEQHAPETCSHCHFRRVTRCGVRCSRCQRLTCVPCRAPTQHGILEAKHIATYNMVLDTGLCDAVLCYACASVRCPTCSKKTHLRAGCGYTKSTLVACKLCGAAGCGGLRTFECSYVGTSDVCRSTSTETFCCLHLKLSPRELDEWFEAVSAKHVSSQTTTMSTTCNPHLSWRTCRACNKTYCGTHVVHCACILCPLQQTLRFLLDSDTETIVLGYALSSQAFSKCRKRVSEKRES